ncbi:MAG: hypothetical protein CFE21_14765 [Bacteroidetes bacterium B1(2017)]|nr:MAG: hypothetical protein CFE21_14765 [Bacteroidetes bacterium B1(2017)]
MKKVKYISLIFAFWLSLTKVQAQATVCPSNIDFELGNFTNWYLYTGVCCPIVTPFLSGPVGSRHTITSGVAVDPYGKFPIADTSKGIFSLKLGNDKVNAEAERARYYVRVPNNTNNYSLLLKYAVVLENPSHLPIEQPRFEVNAYDSSNNAPITCSQFSFVASSVLPGFTLSSKGKDVYFKPWSLASLNLSGYAGKTVAVDFASGDCSKGKHFGYGYVDVNCVLFEISSVACKGSTVSTFTAPPGFMRYRWYDSTFSTLLDTNQIAHIPTPATFNKYHVVLTAYPGFGCDDTLSTTIYTSDLFVKTNPDTFACKNSPIQLRDSAYVSARFMPISYSWNPSTNLSCSTCLNPVVNSNISLKYKLTATDAIGCAATDSVRIIMRSDSITVQPANAQKCLGASATFKAVTAGHGNYTYQWRRNGGNIVGATKDSFTVSNITVADTGTYCVQVRWGCDSSLSALARLSLFPKPIITQQAQSIELCAGSQALFRVSTNGISGISYQWKKNGLNLSGQNKDSIKINSVTAADTGYYKLQVSAVCDTILSDSVLLRLKSTTTILTQPQTQITCIGNRATFKVIATPTPLSYQWKKNGINSIGANLDSLSFMANSLMDTGAYTVLVRGACDSVLSQVASLRLNIPPSITHQPDSFLGCKNARHVLRTNAVGAVTYQWFKNGTAVTLANLDSLVLPSVQVADTGSYYVKVIGLCDTINSALANVKLYAKPSIVLQPIVQTACVGSNLVLRSLASAAQGQSINYKWFKNNAALASANTDSLNLNSITSSDTGYYKTRIIAACDTLFTDSVKVSLLPGVSITLQPLSAISCLNNTQTFKVSATGTGPLSYQWKKNGTAITGAILDTLSFVASSMGDTGSYTVLVKGLCDSAVSQVASFHLNIPPTITHQPDSFLGCKNARHVLRTNAVGAVTYQWFKNGTAIPSANLDSLVLSSVLEADTGIYFVKVIGLCDTSSSASVAVRLYIKPSIVLQPIGKDTCVGSNLVLQCQASVGQGQTLSYVWYKNNSLITSAHSDTLQITSLKASDTAYYKVKIGSACDSIYSDSAKIGMWDAPSLVQDLTDQFKCSNDAVLFKIQAIGKVPLTFTWKKNGVPITGATSDSLFISHAAYSDTGTYQVQVTGQCGVINSSLVSLHLNVPIVILTQPISAQKCHGSTYVLRVMATGANSFNWYKNNLPIIGEHADSLVLTSLSTADTGTYFVSAKASCDSLLSAPASISLYPGINILSMPQNVLLCQGSNAQFVVNAEAYESLTYHWTRNGLNLPTNSDTLKLTTIGVADTGYYKVQVMGRCDTLYSDSARLALRAMPNLQGGAQTFLKCVGDTLSLRASVTGGDTVYYQWKKDGLTIPFATKDSLLITNLTYTDSGNYQVSITSACGVLTSATSKLSFPPAASISAQPSTLNLCFGSSAQLISHAAYSNSVQWYKNNSSIPGATKDTLLFNSLTFSDTGSYYLKATGACSLANSNPASIAVNPLPIGTLPDSSIVCTNVNTLSMPGFTSYTWSNGSNTATTTIRAAGKYKVRFTDANGCVNFDSTHVSLKDLPSIAPLTNQTLCNELPLALNANVSGYDSLRWTSNVAGVFSNSSSVATNFFIATGFTGLAQLTLQTYNSCGLSSAGMQIDYKAKVLATFTPADTIACEGDKPIALNPVNAGGVFSGEQVSSTWFDPKKAGSFVVNYQISSNGCSDITSHSIEVIKVPIALFSYLPSMPTIDFPVVFTSNSIDAKQLLWDFGDGNTANTSTAENLFGNEGNYLVTLTALNAMCFDTTSQQIQILGSNFIWAPNAFTPNGDNVNDLFHIIYKNSKGGTLTIFNRYGETLYTSGNLNDGWDGMYKGKLCQGGVYFYIVEYTDNNGGTKYLKGNITLLD